MEKVKRTLPKVRQRTNFVKDIETENHFNNNQPILTVDDNINSTQTGVEIIDHHPIDKVFDDNYDFKNDDEFLEKDDAEFLEKDDADDLSNSNTIEIVLEVLAVIFVTSLIVKIWQG